MTYVLDTNAWLWLVDCPDRIPQRALAVASDPTNAPLGLSAISIWEVAKKISVGKLELSLPLRLWMPEATNAEGIQLLPLRRRQAVCGHAPATRSAQQRKPLHGVCAVDDYRNLRVTDKEHLWTRGCR